MAETKKPNGYTVTNEGMQEVKAPNQQPKNDGVKSIRGTDLRTGK